MHPEFIKFLNPDNFITRYDSCPDNLEYAEEQYKKGLEVGNKSREINISYNGVWSATDIYGYNMISYERIGYHACTKDLLKGFLDSNAKIIVHREIDDKIQKCVIKESSETGVI